MGDLLHLAVTFVFFGVLVLAVTKWIRPPEPKS
jgi:hypothetical protein